VKVKRFWTDATVFGLRLKERWLVVVDDVDEVARK